MSEPRRILIIDDEPDIREFLNAFLKGFGYEVEEACDGFDALAKLNLGIDLVITDIMMPRMDGFEIIQHIRSSVTWQDLPIIVVTSITSKDQRLKAIELGANDYLTKPIDATEVKVRVGALLRLKESQDALKRHKAELEVIVAQRTEMLRQALTEMAEAQRQTYAAYLETIQKLAVAAEYKDEGTAEHIKRIALYCRCLAQGLQLTPHETELLLQASPMHDVGKIGIPEGLLLKAGALAPEEWQIMQRHTVIGARILHGSSSELLQTGESIALTHHEKWDGSGYPQGLQADKIPLYGRIVAVADVFDALTTRRPYKKAFTNDEALAIIRAGSGKHFDPQIVEVFFDQLDTIFTIQKQYADKPQIVDFDLDKLRY